MEDAEKFYKQLQSQQVALARFGELTLKSDDLNEILTEACRLVCNALHTNFAKVMELQTDETLLVSAGVGWRPGIVGVVRVYAEEGSSEHYTFAAGVPVISENVDDEERFQYPEFMKQHGVKAFVNVPIFGTDSERAFGILEVDSKTPREFSHEDITFLQTYANLVAATVARYQIIQRLKRAVEDKERLFIESQHRTKNNLQLISSFVRLRLKRASTEDAKEHLLSLSRRIETIHLLHDKLYSSGAIDSLDLGAYLSDLATTLLSVQSGDDAINLTIAVEKVLIKPEIAVPVGLILNEFMTNSMKYAFHDGTGTIGVDLCSGDAGVVLRIWDDGKGLPEEPHEGGGTGINLINALARQINAEAVWSSEGGTLVILTFRP